MWTVINSQQRTIYPTPNKNQINPHYYKIKTHLNPNRMYQLLLLQFFFFFLGKCLLLLQMNMLSAIYAIN